MEKTTPFIQQQRNDALPIGGYEQYRKILAGKLVRLRRDLKIVTPKGRKYEPKKLESIPSRDYAIYSAERAWAHAMYIKSSHAADAGDVSLSGPTRTHVISRLAKASKAAGHLVSLVKQGSETAETIAAAAYWRLLEGSVAFESQKWERCLMAYSEAYVLYMALAEKNKGSLYLDWISDNIEPSIRYAAYQQRLPRTLAVPKVVARFVPQESEYVKLALELSPSAIPGDQPASEDGPSSVATQDLPTEISWRGRTVKLEDARVAQALAAAQKAEEKLATFFTSKAVSTRQEKANAFEDILAPSQDAVDATKTAIDELAAEGVASSDQRMQSLQITRTAVNYQLIGWRVGRNRVLCGDDDGASFDPEPPRPPKSRKAKQTSAPKDTKPQKPKGEGSGKKLARLRERVVLYDTTLQSLDSVKELPGVAADQVLLKKVARQKAYFSALRSLAIARSHVVLGNTRNALALFARASQHSSIISDGDGTDGEVLGGSGGKSKTIPQQHVTAAQAQSLKALLESLTLQYRGLVELDALEADAIKAERAKAAWQAPLNERLDEYPAGGADLSNLVSYPPKLRPVPVKPIFLDLAWNYIQYPGQTREIVRENATAVAASEDAEPVEEEKKPARKSWFPFGR